MKLRRDEPPLHFEGLRLRPWILFAGWPLALAAAAAGVVLVGRSPRAAIDAVGLAVGVLAALLIAGLARCRRFETTVGPRLVTFGSGPFTRRVPVGALSPAAVGSARSWRRLYADQELVFELPDHGQSFILPTAEPEELREALDEARTKAHPQPEG